MEIKTFVVVFGTIFLAELGDKTQLATVLFAADPGVSRWTVFAAAAAALVTSAAIGVAAGAWVASHVSERMLNLAAGTGFILIGLWTLARA